MTRRQRLRLNRVLGGASDFLRNFALLFIAAALVDPLFNPERTMAAGTMTLSVLLGLVLLAASLILAWLQED